MTVLSACDPPARDDITGLVLAGGRGSRMGGVDKGLQLLNGTPLARHALDRLAPQVGPLMISANRNLDAYAAFGVPVWPDEPPDYAGPLAGFLAGLMHCGTPWLATVPCDTPAFPADLVRRLAATQADVAIPVTTEQDGVARRQPAFCLLRATLRDDLASFIAGGGRKIDQWLSHHTMAEVPFDDASAFFNANTLDELRGLEQTP
jgi:molybdopterin-guanine dinucleotide biosynthesis protein A